MGNASKLSRWMHRNQGKMMGLGCSAFTALVFTTTGAAIQGEAVISAAQCRAPAYVGSGYYKATVSATDGQLYRIGNELNSYDHAAKIEANRLVETVCSGASVAISYSQSTSDAMPEIIAARPASG